VIRNVCLHVSNEQPLLADLYNLPGASDVGLLCTNVRTLDGKRPIFIDSMTATFFFPFRMIRFLEIPEGAIEAGGITVGPGQAASTAGAAGAAGEPWTEPGSRLPVLVPAANGGDGEDDLEVELEIDEDFLQRIRDI
jgi:hypothetical protein